MADISRELEAILAAIYGEEVRGSIHDAINKINTVTEENTADLNKTETDMYNRMHAFEHEKLDKVLLYAYDSENTAYKTGDSMNVEADIYDYTSLEIYGDYGAFTKVIVEKPDLSDAIDVYADDSQLTFSETWLKDASTDEVITPEENVIYRLTRDSEDYPASLLFIWRSYGMYKIYPRVIQFSLNQSSYEGTHSGLRCDILRTAADNKIVARFTIQDNWQRVPTKTSETNYTIKSEVIKEASASAIDCIHISKIYGLKPVSIPTLPNVIAGEGTSSIIENDLANNKASGNYSHAEGNNTKAEGYASHTEGSITSATKTTSHAEGYKTTSSGYSSHAEGSETVASSHCGHAEGSKAVASGHVSHAEGYKTAASGMYSHAEGFVTKAAGEYQHVSGKYNIADTEDKYAEIIGNGTSDEDRSNAKTLDWDGNETLAGDLYLGPNKQSVLNSLSSVINSSKGDIAYFTDGADDIPVKDLKFHISPIQDLHGYDHPWPEGGGKNLSSVESLPQSFYWGGSYSSLINLLNTLPTGTYTISHKAKIITLPDNMIVEHGRMYITAMVNGSQIPVTTYKTAVDNSPTVGKVYEDYGTFTITEDNVGKINNCYTYCDSTIHTGNGRGVYKIYDIQIELGSTATAYEPYSNICPISGWTEIEGVATGFNVWDEEWEVGTISSQTGETASDPSRIRSKNYIPCVPSTAYCFTKLNVSATSDLRPFFYDADKSFISVGAWSTGKAIQNTPSNCRYMKFICATGYGTTYNHDICINLSDPSRNGTYEPAHVTQIPITLPSEAGTVYGGYVDVTEGKLVVDRASVDLGDLTFSKDTVLSGFDRFAVTLSDMKPTANAAAMLSAISSAYEGKIITDANNTPRAGLMAGLSTSVYFYELSNAFSVAEFKTARSGQTLCYELATPIEYSLTPQQVNSLLGENHIWCDSGETEVEYRADTKLYIDGKIAELQALILENGGN